MLKELKLTNFRRHTSLTLSLTHGLNVIRGANEAGKSTLTEGLAYALFGSTALRNSLAETVTWGQPERSLKVEATLSIEGKDYVFSRSKGGAEVTVDGQVYVSGQKEVAGFASRLIGADAGTAAKLMMAGQGNLRGALEQGPKATSEMVEDLADFNLFETLLERMQDQLPLGSDAGARQRLEDAELKLQDHSLQEPDLNAFEAEILAEDELISEKQAWIDEVGQPNYDAARGAMEAAQSQKRMFTMLSDNLKRAEQQLALHKGQLENAQRKVVAVDTSEIKALEAEIAASDGWSRARTLCAGLGRLVANYPEIAWEGTAESLAEEIDQTSASANAANALHADLMNRKRAALAGIIKDTMCKSCGQPIKDHEAVKARNAELSAEIEALQKEIDAAAAAAYEHSETLQALQAVVKSSAPYQTFLLQNAEFVTADLGFVPPKLSWKGQPPPEVSVDVTELRRRIASIEAAAKASQEAEARVVALKQTLAEDEAEIAAARKNLAEVSDPGDIEALKEESNVAGNAVVLARFAIEDARKRQAELRTQIKLAQQQFEQAKTQRQALEDQVAACRAEIESLSFNNALLKKVRAARPIVADKLWNMVLAAVSTMFTQMRGEKSIVSKGKDGFTVNGESASSLSGSALDLLGLAIRVALTRTFIPAAPWLILDEPAAACSDERTTKLLGFIQSTGFAQTILVTHEDASEAVADNLIVL